jgi:AraC-like DNA-binding protein
MRARPREPIGWGLDDPVSAALVDLSLSGTFFCHSEFDAAWSLDIEKRDFASFHFVGSGSAWLRVGEQDAVEIAAGDLAFVPRSPRMVFSSSARKAGRRVESLPARELAPGVSVLRIGRRPRWQVLCGGVRLSGFVSSLLLELLPDLVILRARDADPVVTAILDAMTRESRAARSGSATLMTRLCDVLVILAMRSWIEAAPQRGWLGAVRDDRLGRAIAAIHREPQRAWSVTSLARLAGLSRSRFSERFVATVGEAPMHYATRLRMHRASELLRREPVTLAELAARFGYDSEPAFVRAFKRHLGVTPGAVRRSGAVRSAKPRGSRRGVVPPA